MRPQPITSQAQVLHINLFRGVHQILHVEMGNQGTNTQYQYKEVSLNNIEMKLLSILHQGKFSFITQSSSQKRSVAGLVFVEIIHFVTFCD
jgi:hypothetical protein